MNWAEQLDRMAHCAAYRAYELDGFSDREAAVDSSGLRCAAAIYTMMASQLDSDWTWTRNPTCLGITLDLAGAFFTETCGVRRMDDESYPGRIAARG
jgi:hypothetical protein